MVGMNVNANAQLGHVGIVEYSKILIFEILNYTYFISLCTLCQRTTEAAPISYENLMLLINVIQLILAPYDLLTFALFCLSSFVVMPSAMAYTSHKRPKSSPIYN